MGGNELTLENIVLREWQAEALETWIRHDRRCIVEAVTGTGKTTLGLAAAVDALNRGLKVLILVPSTALLEQWYEVVRRDLPTVRVGRRNAEHKNDLFDCRILIAVVNSAAADSLRIPPGPGLLVADEVHRYGSEFFARALRDSFTERLGITATLERSDDGVADTLRPYFQHEVVGCDYARAKADGIIAPINVMMVPVRMSALDRDQYLKASNDMSKEWPRLIGDYGCRESPYGEFMSDVKELANNGGFVEAKSAKRYLSAFKERRAVLAGCAAKLDVLNELGAALVEGARSIVFSETIDSAKAAEDALSTAGVLADTITSDDSLVERRHKLKRFARGDISALAAPRLLDEGLDVAEADVGIIVAASASKRQMIQRVGRVIRPKPDGRAATFIVLYAQTTVEDPALGAHEAFLDQLTSIADKRIEVPADHAADQLALWLGQSTEHVAAARAMPRASAFQTLISGHDIIDPVRDGIAASLMTDSAVATDVDIADGLLACMSLLTVKQLQVVVARFGLWSGERASVKETAARLRVAPREVVRIEDEALGRLESPDIAQILEALHARIAAQVRGGRR